MWPIARSLFCGTQLPADSTPGRLERARKWVGRVFGPRLSADRGAEVAACRASQLVFVNAPCVSTPLLPAPLEESLITVNRSRLPVSSNLYLPSWTDAPSARGVERDHVAVDRALAVRDRVAILERAAGECQPPRFRSARIGHADRPGLVFARTLRESTGNATAITTDEPDVACATPGRGAVTHLKAIDAAAAAP